jgi:hypothetical protein
MYGFFVFRETERRFRLSEMKHDYQQTSKIQHASSQAILKAFCYWDSLAGLFIFSFDNFKQIFLVTKFSDNVPVMYEGLGGFSVLHVNEISWVKSDSFTSVLVVHLCTVYLIASPPPPRGKGG